MGQIAALTEANFERGVSDDEPALAAQAGVLRIPHLVLYRDGVRVAASGGARPNPAVVEALSLDQHATAE